jgi:hypothetical protein
MIGNKKHQSLLEKKQEKKKKTNGRREIKKIFTLKPLLVLSCQCAMSKQD